MRLARRMVGMIAAVGLMMGMVVPAVPVFAVTSRSTASSKCSEWGGSFEDRGSSGGACRNMSGDQWAGQCSNYGGTYSSRTCTWSSLDYSGGGNNGGGNNNNGGGGNNGGDNNGGGGNNGGAADNNAGGNNGGGNNNGGGVDVDGVTAVDRSSGVKTAILKDCGDEAGGVNGEGIFCIVGIGLNILTYGVGILGTLGLVISGVQYATAAGDPARMTKAKSRIFQIVIGLVLYAIMYVLISFLIPGGL